MKIIPPIGKRYELFAKLSSRFRKSSVNYYLFTQKIRKPR